MSFTNHPKTEWYKTTTVYYARRFCGWTLGQDMAGRSLPRALDGKTQRTGSDSKARRLKSSEGFFTRVFGVWAVMTRAGLSELGQHVASPCGLGTVIGWWSQGHQFLQ